MLSRSETSPFSGDPGWGGCARETAPPPSPEPGATPGPWGPSRAPRAAGSAAPEPQCPPSLGAGSAGGVDRPPELPEPAGRGAGGRNEIHKGVTTCRLTPAGARTCQGGLLHPLAQPSPAHRQPAASTFSSQLSFNFRVRRNLPPRPPPRPRDPLLNPAGPALHLAPPYARAGSPDELSRRSVSEGSAAALGPGAGASRGGTSEQQRWAETADDDRVAPGNLSVVMPTCKFHLCAQIAFTPLPASLHPPPPQLNDSVKTSTVLTK